MSFITSKPITSLRLIVGIRLWGDNTGFWAIGCGQYVMDMCIFYVIIRFIIKFIIYKTYNEPYCH